MHIFYIIEVLLKSILRILWPQRKLDVWCHLLWIVLVTSIIQLVWGFDGELGEELRFLPFIFLILLVWISVIAYVIHVVDEIKIFNQKIRIGESPELYHGKVKIIVIILFLLLLINTRRDVDSSIKDLKGGSDDQKIEAIEYLVNSNDTRAIEPLIIALSDEDRDVQRLAAYALETIADSRAVEPLIIALSGKNSVARGAASEILGKIGDTRAVEPLIIALSDGYGTAAKALGNIGDVRAVEPLIIALNDESYYVRCASAEALGDIGDTRAVEPLIIALSDENLFVQQSSAKALGNICDTRAVEPLIIALKDSLVRQSAAEALRKIGIEKLLPVQQAKYYIYIGNYKMAAEIGEIAVAPLIVELTNKESDVRKSATKALKIIGKPAVDRLIITLGNEEYFVRQSAAEALGNIGDTLAVEALIVALNDEEYIVRQSAAEALGEIADSRAVDPLIVALRDEAYGVRRYAAEALPNIEQISIESLKERVSTMINDDWIRIALTLCGHKESADKVLYKLEQDFYSADMRCFMIGWFGSENMPSQLEIFTYGRKLRIAARNQYLSYNDWSTALQKCVNDASRHDITLSAIPIAKIDIFSKRQSLVEELCMGYIRRGDIRSIPILKELLNEYGSRRLAEIYLNSGHRDLESEAESWAFYHGYPIVGGDTISIGAGWGRDR